MIIMVKRGIAAMEEVANLSPVGWAFRDETEKRGVDTRLLCVWFMDTQFVVLCNENIDLL